MAERLLFAFESFEESELEQAYLSEITPHSDVVFAHFKNPQFMDRFSPFRKEVAQVIYNIVDKLKDASFLENFGKRNTLNIEYKLAFFKLKSDLKAFRIDNPDGEKLFRHDDYYLFHRIKETLAELDRPDWSRYKKDVEELEKILARTKVKSLPRLLTPEIKEHLREMLRINEVKIRESEIYKENIQLRNELTKLRAAHKRLEEDTASFVTDSYKRAEEIMYEKVVVEQENEKLKAQRGLQDKAIEALQAEIAALKQYKETLEQLLVKNLRDAVATIDAVAPKVIIEPAGRDDTSSATYKLSLAQEEIAGLRHQVSYLAQQLEATIQKSPPSTPKASRTSSDSEGQKTPQRVAPGSPQALSFE